MDSLSSLKSLTNLSDESDQLIYLRPDQIDPDPEQDRRDWDAPETLAYLNEMAESVKEQGVRRPIEVKVHPADPKRWMIIAGEVRWRSAVTAKLETVPCLWRKRITDQQASLDMLTENVNRKGLNVLELSAALQRRIDEGISRESLIQATGKSKSWISKRLSLLKMHDDVLALAREGVVTDPDNLLSINKLPSSDREKALELLHKGKPIKTILEKVGKEKPAKSVVALAEEDLQDQDSKENVAPITEGTSHIDEANISLSLPLAKAILLKYEPHLLNEGDEVIDAWELFLGSVGRE